MPSRRFSLLALLVVCLVTVDARAADPFDRHTSEQLRQALSESDAVASLSMAAAGKDIINSKTVTPKFANERNRTCIPVLRQSVRFDPTIAGGSRSGARIASGRRYAHLDFFWDAGPHGSPRPNKTRRDSCGGTIVCHSPDRP